MKDIFCANCQKVTPHKGSVDANGEFLFECQNELEPAVAASEGVEAKPAVLCTRFVKFPADTTPETFATYLNAHQASNAGQVKIEVQEKRLADLLA